PRMSRMAPRNPPIAKVIAASWNGGTRPDMTVKSDRNDQVRMAARPASVARCAMDMVGRPDARQRLSEAARERHANATRRAVSDVGWLRPSPILAQLRTPKPTTAVANRAAWTAGPPTPESKRGRAHACHAISGRGRACRTFPDDRVLRQS